MKGRRQPARPRREAGGPGPAALGRAAGPQGTALPAAPVHPGQVVQVEVRDLGHAGEGVGRYQDFTLFVPGALPGETVQARVTEVHKNYGRAELVAVEAPSPARVAPPCPAFAECGGCQIQHLAYPEQLRAKEAQVRAAVERIGGLRGVTVHPVIGMADPWHYRNKAQFPVGLSGGQLVAGCYARGTHRIVDVADCLIQHPTANKVLRAVREQVLRFGIPPYDEATHTGVLRHVLVRVSHLSGEAMCILVTRTAELPHDHELAGALMAAVPELASLWQNINPRRTNVVLGDESVHLAGRETLIDRIGDLRFHISPRSFYQVNPVQTEVLYSKALEYAALSGDEVAIDAYCGIGTITLFLARRAGHVYGIEVVPEAVRDARANADLNGITNVTFLEGDAAAVLPRLAQEEVRPAVVVFDPPRKGCDPPALEAAAAMGPERIVYVSCNPATLARDMARLAALGYRPVEVQPVDMFPHTAHVECCALLVREG